MLTVFYRAELDRFEIRTEAPVPMIGEWVGWKRVLTLRDMSVLYAAPAWVSSVLGMKPGPSLQLTWTLNAQSKRDCLLHNLARARELLSGGALVPIVCPTERKPKKHQQQAVCAMGHMDWRLLLGDHMGLGKTSEALWALESSKSNRVLVVCPVSAKFNWQNELIATLGGPDAARGWDPYVIDGTPKKRASQLAEALGPGDFRVAIIINYDLLRHLSAEQFAELMGWIEPGMLLLDESHYVKSRDSDRTKLCTKLAHSACFAIALTGTPVRNTVEDLYSQVEIIRPGTWTSFRDFEKRHLVIRSVQFGKRMTRQVVGAKNLDELNAVMNTLQIVRKKQDVLDLPPKVRTFPELELDGDLLKLYKAMRDFARLELEALMRSEVGSQPLTIFNPRARSAVESAMRCEQISQGFIGGIPQPVMDRLDLDLLKHAVKIDGRPNELVFPHAPKLVWLLETIDTILAQGGAPAVITRFNAPMFWLKNYLAGRKIRVGLMHGAMSAAEKDSVPRAFQNKEFDVLVAQVRICEVWNATRCQDVLFLGRDWSPAINEQAEDRFYRIGTKGTVNVQIPIVRGTIEVMIDRKLRAKNADAEQALRTVTIQELMEAL